MLPQNWREPVRVVSLTAILFMFQINLINDSFIDSNLRVYVNDKSKLLNHILNLAVINIFQEYHLNLQL